jgi:serine phosphatase RsbU (regulator of sigma subunit)
MLRVATGARDVRLVVAPHGITSAGVEHHMVSTQADASVWLRYSDGRGDRFISAADILGNRVAPERIHGRMVLIGVTALGLADRHPIPGGRTMDGVEIHAELLDSLLDDALLTRPGWATWTEAAFLFLGGTLLVFVVPMKRGRAAPLVLIPLLVVAVAGGLALFHWGFLLVDAATPSLGLTLVFTVMLAVTLGEAERQRRALRRQIEQQREAAARMEGELSAARRIQMGILPKPADVLAGESRFDLEIVLEPAREVGGDLYDIFRLDDRRLFFLLGDVSGKGLPGSLFMAVSKSLYKSTALRRGGAVATMMREANAEISRDNPEALFVTAFAGVLDLEEGVLEYCNAGHDPPYLLPGAGGSSARLTEAGGPPLCVLEEFKYEAARRRLAPGDLLCLVTDGVTEATNAEGELYGRARLEAVLASAPVGTGAKALAGAIREDVKQFVAGAEPADDLAIMILRWLAPKI